MKFPKILFVKIAEEGTEDEFLLADGDVTNLAEMDTPVKIAQYELKSKNTLSTTITLE